MKNIKKLIGIILITSLMSGCNTPSKGNTSNSNIENTDTQEANVSVTSVSLNVNQLQIYDDAVSPNGDTDGIDSNGSYTQSGGIVIARGPNSSMAAALDTDGAVSVSGGTLIVLGSIEKTPSLTNMPTTTGLSGHSIGDHTIAFGEELVSYNNKYSYAKTTVYSSLGKGVIQ